RRGTPPQPYRGWCDRNYESRWFGRSRRSHRSCGFPFYFRLARQPEDPFGDQVADDLRSAAGDGQTAAEQVVVHYLLFFPDQHAWAGDGQREFSDPLRVLSPEKFRDV